MRAALPAWRTREPSPVNSSDSQAANNDPGGGDAARTIDSPRGVSPQGDSPRGDSPWVRRLLTLHRQVRSAVAKADRAGTGSVNAKGDDVKRFDLVADEAASAVLGELQLPLVVDSEESGRQEIGSGTPRHRLVLDPVDGSDNWARGLPLSAFSCAVLPVDAPLHPDWVEAALVGPLEQEIPLIALKGCGAWRENDRLETSKVRDITEAMISVELNHYSPSPGLARLTEAASSATRSKRLTSSPFAFLDPVPARSAFATALRTWRWSVSNRSTQGESAVQALFPMSGPLLLVG